MWLWQKHPGLVPGTQTNWASFEASVLANLPPGKCLRVFCGTKIMGTSHASDFLATTKVRIQLWSSLNRCLGQSIQRGYPKLDEICLNLPQSEMLSQNSFFLTLQQSIFCHLVLPLLNQLPHLPTYAPHFAMAKFISFLN